MDTLITLIMGLGVLGLIWLALARFGSNKTDWKNKDRAKAFEMIGTGLVMLLVGILVIGLFEA